MTTLNVSFSTAMMTQLKTPGVWAQAVYFDSNGANPVWTPLAGQGSLQEWVPIALPQMKGGKIYFLVASTDASETTNPFTSVITKESDISIESAQQNNYRFDSFEFTLQGDPSDQGNLTSVVGFGLPMGVAIEYQDPAKSPATVGYNASGQTMFSLIQAIDPSNAGLVFNFTEGVLAGTTPVVHRYGTSPASASQVTPEPFSAADWAGYINDLKVAGTDIARISGIFNGAADAKKVWHNQGLFNYSLTWDGSNFWLEPEANSQIKGYVKISPTDLANSIYATQGNAYVYTNKTDATPYTIYESGTTAMNVGANNQWGELFTQLLTGLSAGFLGGTAGYSPNAQVTQTIDLSKNWNWEPIYAFGPEKLTTGQSAHWFSDPYSKIFFLNSNSYGSGYSDNLMSRYSEGGPLISLGDINGNVSAIQLMLYADSDIPYKVDQPAGSLASAPAATGMSLSSGELSPDWLSGYTPPVLYNYIAPPDQGYAWAADTLSGANLSFALSNPAGAAAGATSWVADPSLMAVTFRFLDETGHWQSVSFNAAQGGSGGLWQNWSIQKGPSGYSIIPTPDTAQTDGNFIISQLPLSSADSATTWYQLDIQNTGTLETKTFNIYANSSNGQFLTAQGNQAADGGALTSITPAAPLMPTFKVNLFPGSSNAIDPDLLIPGGQTSGSTPMFGTPAAPVAGTIAGGQFTALAGQNALAGNTVTTAQSALAFGWTGLNSATDTASWISNYTNKTSALNTARVAYSDASGTTAYVSVAADIDGQWQTSPVVLDPGAYTVTFTEYAASDTAFASPFGTPSDSLNLTLTGAGQIRDAYIVMPNQSVITTAASGVLGNDAPKTTPTVKLHAAPEHGTVNLGADGSFAYTPKASVHKVDTLSYTTTHADGTTGGAKALFYVVPTEQGVRNATELDFDALPQDIQLAAMYLAYMNRGVDLAAARQWLGTSDDTSGRLSELAFSLALSPESLGSRPTSWAPRANTNDEIKTFLDATWQRLFNEQPDDDTVLYWTQIISEKISNGQSLTPLLYEIMESANTSQMAALVSKAAVAANYLHLQQQFGTSLDGQGVADILNNVTAAPETVLSGMAATHYLALEHILG